MKSKEVIKMTRMKSCFNPNLSGSKKWRAEMVCDNNLRVLVSILIYLEVKNEV